MFKEKNLRRLRRRQRDGGFQSGRMQFFPFGRLRELTSRKQNSNKRKSWPLAAEIFKVRNLPSLLGRQRRWGFPKGENAILPLWSFARIYFVRTKFKQGKSRPLAAEIFKIIVLIFLFFSHPVQASAASELGELLTNFHTMRAEFTQTVYGNTANQKSRGRLAIVRPGKFRWNIISPNHQLIIADGKQIWIYDADLQQATHQQLTHEQANSPAMLLSGSTGNIIQRFNIRSISTSIKNEQSFKLIPKSSGDLFQWVELNFMNKKLVGMRLMDNLGSLSIFKFNNIDLNAPLSDKLFIFNVPPNVDLITN